MNVRRLTIIMMMIGGLCLALSSRSTLLPDRGSDHVFYGAIENDFLAEEMAVGDFDGDFLDDIVTTVLWDDPACGGYVLNRNNPTATICGTYHWTSFLAENGVDTMSVCRYPTSGPYAGDNEEHWSYWACLGYDSIPGSATGCDTCYTAEFLAENQGAAYVFYGGDWSGKGHDIDLSAGGANLIVLGKEPRGRIYNAMAAGDMDGDGKDELAIAAPAADAGEVYVIRGSAAWPDTIDLADPSDFGTWVLYYLSGASDGDEFGMGLAMGDLNGDELDELIISAPAADSEAGRVYAFYPNEFMPSSVGLDTMGTHDIDDYAQVIFGGTAGDNLGVTHIRELHPPHHGIAAHNGAYDPVGIAVGNWDGQGSNDLAIGAGAAASGEGRAYVIFGGTKLAPGNPIYLSNSPGASSTVCDIRIAGEDSILCGAALEFVDADGGNGNDDLLIGAPLFGGDGKAQRGEVFIIFGNTQSNLVSVGSRQRSVATANHTDVKIYGRDAYDQLGGHFSGKLDIDNDGKNDVGLAGKSEMTLIFGQSQGAWGDTLDLSTSITENPAIRILDFQPQQYASSTTIRLLDLDGDDYHDLVFGGYDSPGYTFPLDPTGDSGTKHAGQMWVTKGSDMWKHGYVSSNQTWSGNVFMDGDVVVTGGATLTIAAGTDIWAWPTDVQKNGLGADTVRVEIRILDGALIVQGTAADRVRFLAYDPDSPTASGNNKWFGIWIDDDCGFSSINYAEIRNATRAIQARSSLEVKNSVITDYLIAGISVAGDSTDVDSLYLYETEIVSSDPDTAIGLNILGMKAVARVEDLNRPGFSGDSVS